MIAVIWEDVNNCINSIINSLNSKFPREARYYLSKRPQASEIELLTRPPLVFLGWLIYANKRTDLRILAQLNDCKSQNIIVIRVNNQKEYKDMQSRLQIYGAKFFDNHILGKEQILKWIQSELNCSEDVAKYLYFRVGGYLKEIVFAVQNLQRSGKEVTRKLIRELVDKTQSVSMFDVTEYLIGVQNDRTSREAVFNTLYTFRYAESWVLKTIKSELTSYIKTTKLIADCVLDITNYTTQVSMIDDKDVRDLPRWKLKRIILNYGKVSLERIIYVKGLIDQIGKTHFDLIKILQLMSIGGD